VGRRLILDTNILITYERNRLDRTQFDDDDLAMAAISVAEFREGAVRADSDERRRARLAALEDLRGVVSLLDYTEATAIAHAPLLAIARGSGRPRSAHDLIIAAHAAQTGRTIVTRDAAARFGNLPGVSAIDPAGG
jgi:tRNA(fMet)-specific endonuclease VapC